MSNGTTFRRVTTGLLVLLAFPLGLAAQTDVVLNGSMELGPGPNGPDETKAADWTFFGPTVERTTEEALSGTHAFKAFGSDPTVGAFQDVACSPGDSVSAGVMMYTRSTDQIGADAYAGIKIEYYDAGDAQIGSGTEVTVLNSASTADVWTAGSIPAETAPAGTTYVRLVCFFAFTSASQGSAYFDDCQLTVAGSNDLLNGDFETAGTSGQTPFGIDDWIGFGTQEKSDEQADDGVSSVKIQVGDGFGSFCGLFQNMVDLSAGDRIQMRARVWNPGTGGLTGSAAAAIKLEFDPTEGTELPEPEEFLAFDANSPTNTWELVEYSTTVPDDVTLARIVLLANDVDPNNGPVYFETASATRSNSTDPNAPDPNENQLLNASFELGTSGTNGLTNWTEFRGFSCSARKSTFEAPPLDGTSTLKISGSCVAGVYQDVPVKPGETLTISARCYSFSSDPFESPDSTAGVKVEWVGGVVPPDIDIGAGSNTATASAATDEWIDLTIDYTMPPGSAALTRFTLIASQGNSTDTTVYFDSCEALVTYAGGGCSAACDVAGGDADVNDDCLIDLSDLAVVLANFGAGPGATSADGDTNGDGFVDLTDLANVLSLFGTSCM